MPSKTPSAATPERLFAGSVCVAKRVMWAREWGEQLRGVIGRRLEIGDALLLPGCSQVHTAFVAYPLTVAFCRAEPGAGGAATWRVLFVQTLPPFRVSRYVRGANMAVEARADSTLRGVSVGDLLTETPQA